MESDKPTITAEAIIAILEPVTVHFKAEFYGWCFDHPNPRFSQDLTNGQVWAKETIKKYCERFTISSLDLELLHKHFQILVEGDENDFDDETIDY